MATRPPYVNPGARPNRQEEQTVELLDHLEAFEQFEREVLPALRQAVVNGENPSVLRKRYLTHMTARLITEALTNPDASKALAAIKEAFDREEGKATEKKDVTHRLGRLPEKELDALLLSEIDDMPEDLLEDGSGGPKE